MISRIRVVIIIIMMFIIIIIIIIIKILIIVISMATSFQNKVPRALTIVFGGKHCER